MKLVFSILIAVLVCPLRSVSQFTFIHQPYSATAVSTSSAAVASGGDVVAQAYANPAMVDSSAQEHFYLGVANGVEGTRIANLAYADGFKKLGIVHMQVRFINLASMVERDEAGNEIGSFAASQVEWGIGFARHYSKTLTYGLTLRTLYSTAAGASAFGLVGDLGLYYAGTGGLRAGLTADGLGRAFSNYGGAAQTMNPRLMASIGRRLSNAPLALYLNLNDLQRWDLADADAEAQEITETNSLTGETSRRVYTFDNLLRHVGAHVSFMPNDKFQLTVGYSFRRRLELASAARPALVGFSGGLQLRLKRFDMHFARSASALGSVSNQVAVTLRLGEYRKRKEIKPS